MMRVLLIEDEPSTAKAVEIMLSGEGFNVYTTNLGEEGIDLGRLYDYDIICLDLNLPDMNGYDVLKKLRAARVETPILILSGYADIESKLRGFGMGADAFHMTAPNVDGPKRARQTSGTVSTRQLRARSADSRPPRPMPPRNSMP